MSSCISGSQFHLSLISKYHQVHPRRGHAGARWMWVVNATPRLLYPGKETRYPLYRRLVGSQSRCGRPKYHSGSIRLYLKPFATCFDHFTISRTTISAVSRHVKVIICILFLHIRRYPLKRRFAPYTLHGVT